MKRFLRPLLMLVVLAAVCIFLNPAEAKAATVSDLTFQRNSDGKSYAVTGCKATASGELTIPATYNGLPVTAIDATAFVERVNLTGVTIPNSVTRIGNAAFAGCTGLTDIVIPDSVTTIGDGAFSNCIGLTSLTIPSSVTSMSNSAFGGCAIKELTIAEGFTTVTSSMIVCRDSLEKVNLPNGLTAIGDYAFTGCTRLTGVNIPDSVTTIGISAFSSCTGLTGITIPDGVTTIGDAAFAGCSRMTDVTLPDSVTVIGNAAFSGCTGLTDVTVPSGVTVVGNAAFSDCSGLTDVTIPNGVAAIGDAAFSGCTGLVNVTLPDSLTTIGASAFSSCRSLRVVTLPNSVTTIGEAAFVGCIGLTEVTIPNGVVTIEAAAFVECTNLTSVTIPNSVASIADAAFAGCVSLTDVYYIGTQAQWNAIAIRSANEFLTSAKLHLVSPCAVYGHTEEIIPGKAPTATEAGLTEGKKCGLCGDILIAQEEIPALLTFTLDSKGQYYTLSKCATSVAGEVAIPATYKGLPVTAIGPSAFSGCTKIQTISIPASVQKIGYAAFYNCKALTELTIPEGVTDIQYSTFGGCTGLLKVSLPDSVVRIGELAFDNCKSLKTLAIPEGVTSIDRVAFFNCRSLEGIKLPKTLTFLGESVFYDCKSLTSVTIPGSLTKVEKSMFYGCSELEEVVIEDGVKTVSEYAFYNCTALKTVTIADDVTYIGYFAFGNCIALTDVYYSGSQAQWDALALDNSNAPLVNAALHFSDPCAQGHTYDHDFDATCNVCGAVRQLDNTYKFVNYRVVFSDPDTTHKNLRVEVYKLGDMTVADPTDEKVLKAIDPNAVTHWQVYNINRILVTDAGNYVLLLKYNIGTGAAIKVPLVISVSADPKLIIDKNNKITGIDNNTDNINHRVVVYYLGSQTVEDIYDEAALKAIDSAPETHWQMTRINRLALIKGGNYVLHLCYNEGVSAKITVAQQFTVESIPSLSVDINNKVVVTEENAENRNHRAVVYFLGDTLIEDPYDEAAVKAAAITTSKTYWGLTEINGIELKDGGNYVIHLYYNVGTSEKRTLALDITLNERPALSVDENGKIAVSYTDPEINNPRAYIYNVGDESVADIYDEAALKAIATPTQLWGLSSIQSKTLTPGTYVIHFYYSVGTSAKKTVALKVTI